MKKKFQAVYHQIPPQQQQKFVGGLKIRKADLKLLQQCTFIILTAQMSSQESAGSKLRKTQTD